MPPLVAIPVHDGDGARPSDGMPFGEECRGHWVFTASSKQAPQVVDLNLNPIINQTEVYSGMYARVSINFFAYNSNGKKGIGCGLGNVQKVEDGEPLGSRTTAADDFGSMQAMGQPVPQQQVYPQPVQPVYPQVAQQPVYPQPQAQSYAQQAQPAYSQQQQAIDPITGAPVVPGGVLGM